MRIGLRSGGGICRERRPQIAEARHEHDAKAVLCQRSGHLERLVEAAACAVDEKHRRSVAEHRILDRPAARLRNLASGGDALTGCAHVPLVSDEDYRERCSDEEQDDHGRFHRCRAISTIGIQASI